MRRRNPYDVFTAHLLVRVADTATNACGIPLGVNDGPVISKNWCSYKDAQGYKPCVVCIELFDLVKLAELNI